MRDIGRGEKGSNMGGRLEDSFKKTFINNIEKRTEGYLQMPEKKKDGVMRGVCQSSCLGRQSVRWCDRRRMERREY